MKYIITESQIETYNNYLNTIFDRVFNIDNLMYSNSEEDEDLWDFYTEEKGGKNVVKNLRLVAIDCVADPSYPKAFVNGILESKQYVLKESGQYEEVYNTFENRINNLPKHDVESYLKESIINFLKNIK